MTAPAPAIRFGILRLRDAMAGRKGLDHVPELAVFLP